MAALQLGVIVKHRFDPNAELNLSTSPLRPRFIRVLPMLVEDLLDGVAR